MLFGLRAALPVFARPIQVENDNAFLVNDMKETA
jgi:hypothetical protein